MPARIAPAVVIVSRRTRKCCVSAWMSRRRRCSGQLGIQRAAAAARCAVSTTCGTVRCPQARGPRPIGHASARWPSMPPAQSRRRRSRGAELARARSSASAVARSRWKVGSWRAAVTASRGTLVGESDDVVEGALGDPEGHAGKASRRRGRWRDADDRGVDARLALQRHERPLGRALTTPSTLKWWLPVPRIPVTCHVSSIVISSGVNRRHAQLRGAVDDPFDAVRRTASRRARSRWRTPIGRRRGSRRRPARSSRSG